MKANDYKLRHTMGERIIRLIEGNSYVQLAIITTVIVILFNILPAWVSQMNYFWWGME